MLTHVCGQIVSYGISCNLDVTRVKPKISSKNDEVVDVVWKTDENGRKLGISVWYKSTLTTRYKMVNNGDKGVEKLYVDHSAFSHNDGYSVTTTESAVKQVTGFTRYEFSLGEGEERDFDVSEEAVYEGRMLETSNVSEFSVNMLPGLVSDGVVTGKFLSEVESFLAWRTLKGCVNDIMNCRGVITLACVKGVMTKDYLRSIVHDCEKKAGLEAEVARKKRGMQAQKKNVEGIKDIQSRLRENIRGLEKVAGSKSAETLLSRYLKDLNAQEDELVKIGKLIETGEEEVFRVGSMIDSLAGKICDDCRNALKVIDQMN